MKTLTLLLLLTISVMGQIDSLKNKGNLIYPVIPTQTIGDSLTLAQKLDIGFNQEMERWRTHRINITLGDLLDYEKECYADSSLAYSWYQTDTTKTKPENSLWDYFIQHNVYDHRQPTFQGFIEFLKKRK